MMTAEAGGMHCEDGGRSHETRNVGSIWKLEKARDAAPPGACRRKEALQRLDFSSFRLTSDF